MNDQKDIEIRSEEVQEILGTPPNWMARYGTLLAMLVVVGIGYIAYFVEYPVVVYGNITVTTTAPPKRLVTNMRGRIKEVMVENESNVTQGQVILVFESTARATDVLTLENRLMSLSAPTDDALMQFSVPDSLVLGNLKEPLFNFYRKQEDLRTLVENSYDNFSVSQLRRRIDQLREGLRADRSKWINLDKEIELVQRDLQKQEQLSSEQLLAERDLRQTQAELLSLMRMRESAEASIRSAEQEIDRLRAEITGVRANTEGVRQQTSVELREAFLELRTAVEDWLSKYVLTSPIDGKVSLYMDRINDQQFIEEEKQIGVVVPSKDSDIKGLIKLRVGQARVVKEGQEVLVRFKSADSKEHGAVRGRVTDVSEVPIENELNVEVSFPDGLVTNRGTTLANVQAMEGRANIIVAEKRFLQRVFESLLD
ncbi:MAG: HlyD family efflux transporter periplasmic adaptor subunit [Bacteroidetes bacterium]|jgi:multidrug resistance efflux pump|nr:HlyD family efflux transporter periplasmic adaptor subunit [Bacteroidota bacterium]